MTTGRAVSQRSRLLRHAIAAASLAAIASGPKLQAQTPRPASPVANTAAVSGARRAPGRLLGVFDGQSSAPIDGAEVVDLFVDDVYRTGATGLVGLWALHQRNDSVAVRVRKLGYADTAFAVLVGPGDTIPVAIYLRRQVRLPTVITDALANRHLTPNQAEFEGRLNDPSIHGHFLTRADLDKQPTRSISHVLESLIAGRSRGCNVPPMVYVDGVRAPMSGADTLITRAGDYEGIEYYTSGAAPPRFGGTLEATSGSAGIMAAPGNGAGGIGVAGTVAGAAGPSGSPSSIRASNSCGVILLWRRETP